MSKANDDVLTPEQKEAIDQRIHRYLMEHPHVLLEASEKLRHEQLLRLVQSQTPLLLHAPSSPSFGPQDASVHVIEFFDYHCRYCQKIAPVVERLRTHYPQVRFVYKELPILGTSSKTMSWMALAAHRKGLYLKAHELLMKNKGGGIPAQAFQDLVFSDRVSDFKNLLSEQAFRLEVDQNIHTAQRLGFERTPVFLLIKLPLRSSDDVILFPGYVTESVLSESISRLIQRGTS